MQAGAAQHLNTIACPPDEMRGDAELRVNCTACSQLWPLCDGCTHRIVPAEWMETEFCDRSSPFVGAARVGQQSGWLPCIQRGSTDCA